MDDINFKDIRVLPSSLDIKSNVGKSHIEILAQLQSGSTVKGLVVETNIKGEVIFDTAYGKFSAPNKHDLVSGDSVSLKLSNVRGEASGNILSINNKKIDSDELLKLEPVRLTQTLQNKISDTQLVNESHVTIKNVGNMPKVISGLVSYLNLTGMDKSSSLFKVISHAAGQNNPKLPIAANVVFSNQPSTAAFTFNGIVSGNGKEGEQLIRTAFGIIATQGTKMPVGQKLVLEMTSLNNQPLDKDVTKAVADFVFKVSNFDSSVKKFAALFANNPVTPEKTTESQNLQSIPTKVISLMSNTQSSGQKTETVELPLVADQKNNNQISSDNKETKLFQAPNTFNTNQLFENSSKLLAPFAKLEKPSVDNSKTKLSEETEHDSAAIDRSLTGSLAKLKRTSMGQQSYTARSLNSIISLFADNDEIKKLATEYQNIKELLTPFVQDENDNFKWHSVFIPFHNGQRVMEQEVKIDRSREHYLRFIFNVDFEENSMQIDGLIHFENNNNTPKTFDMTLRSKNKLDPGLSKRIADIYGLNQSMTGVRGALLIEGFDRFVEA